MGRRRPLVVRLDVGCSLEALGNDNIVEEAPTKPAVLSPERAHQEFSPVANNACDPSETSSLEHVQAVLDYALAGNFKK